MHLSPRAFSVPRCPALPTPPSQNTGPPPGSVEQPPPRSESTPALWSFHLKATVTQEKSRGLLCFELQSHLCQVRMPLASWCVNPPLPPTRVEPGPAWVQIPGNQVLQTDIGTDILSDNFPSCFPPATSPLCLSLFLVWFPLC